MLPAHRWHVGSRPSVNDWAKLWGRSTRHRPLQLTWSLAAMRTNLLRAAIHMQKGLRRDREGRNKTTEAREGYDHCTVVGLQPDCGGRRMHAHRIAHSRTTFSHRSRFPWTCAVSGRATKAGHSGAQAINCAEDMTGGKRPDKRTIRLTEVSKWRVSGGTSRNATFKGRLMIGLCSDVRLIEAS